MAENIKEEIEDKIIDLISLNAGGRLVVFKPENSDKDLIVEKRGDYIKKTISLNVYGKEKISQLVLDKKLKPEDNFYLLFVDFDIVKQDINDNFLVVPSLDFQRLSKQNNFSEFLTNKKNFVRFLIKK